MAQMKHTGYKFFLLILIVLYIIQYFLDISGESIVRMPVIVDAILYCAIFVIYLFKYRKDNLLCFELMAVPVAFIGLFFDDIIYPLSSELYSFFTFGDDFIRMKSEDIQMIAFLFLILGLSIGNDIRPEKYKILSNQSTSNVSYDSLIRVFGVILLLLIAFDYYNGTFSTWFYYSNSDWMEEEDRNQGLGHLTCFLLASSCIEIVRLREKGVENFKSFVKNCNKLFFVEWLGVSIMLYVTGNRNEMLLILMPLVVGYTVCIKRINNKMLVVFLGIGVLLMVISGLTRQKGLSINGISLDVLSFTHDFANLGYDTDFLIDYTDNKGQTCFLGLGRQLLSGIPLLGNAILQVLNTPANLPIASATLCTESTVSTSGLGTSLIGDLYYTSGFIWVILYMFFYGFLMSVLYHSRSNINIYWLLFYSYNVANAAYYVRSSWAFPITIVEYSIVIVFIGCLLFRKRAVVR